MELISVVIPAYNYARYLDQAIESVLSQTYENIEIIVVDDGSIDNTQQVVTGIHHPQLKYIYQENRGLSAARNTGIRSSHGEFIGFLDADDYWLPSKLVFQMELFQKLPDSGLIYGGYNVVNKVGDFLACRTPEAVEKDWYKELLLRNYVAGSSSTSLVRRECFSLLGGFDENLRAVEDWDMWLRIARYFPLRCVQESVSCIRLHDSNMTQNPALLLSGFIKVINKNLSASDQDPDILNHKNQIYANAYLRAAVFASRRSKFIISLKYSLKSLLIHPTIDSFAVIIKSILHKKT
jgi:glycosyltransferase involved in cell wall biosynthesis